MQVMATNQAQQVIAVPPNLQMHTPNQVQQMVAVPPKAHMYAPRPPQQMVAIPPQQLVPAPPNTQILQKPAEYKNVFDPKVILVAEDKECTVPSALDKLGQTPHVEIEALLKANEHGVARFFSAKGCPEIGVALAQKNVTGTNLNMLTAHDIETDLGLNLGQQLALKHFMQNVQDVAKGNRRNELVWDGDEFKRSEKRERKEGLFPRSVIGLFEACSGGEIKINKVRLPPQHYTLTNSTLKVVSAEWSDGTPAQKERFVIDDQKPQYKTITDNIDLLNVDDVDHFKLSVERRKIKHGCCGICLGKEHRTTTEPAEIVLSYIDKGCHDGGDQRRQLRMRLHPEQVDDLSDKIISAKNELAAEHYIRPEFNA